MKTLGLIVLVTSCRALECPRYESNKETFERVFLACLDRSQHGPQQLTASGNDLDEVIDSCRGVAREASSELAAVCR